MNIKMDYFPSIQHLIYYILFMNIKNIVRV